VNDNKGHIQLQGFYVTMEVIAEPMEDNIVSRRLGSRSDGFFSWREFGWGALASGFGETLLHPVDTLKTRIQSGGQTGFSLQVVNLIPPPPPVFRFLQLFFLSCRNCIFCNSFACQVHSNIPAFQHAWFGVFIKQKSKPPVSGCIQPLHKVIHYRCMRVSLVR
jgi:hypothetical protein